MYHNTRSVVHYNSQRDMNVHTSGVKHLLNNTQPLTATIFRQGKTPKPTYIQKKIISYEKFYKWRNSLSKSDNAKPKKEKTKLMKDCSFITQTKDNSHLIIQSSIRDTDQPDSPPSTSNSKLFPGCQVFFFVLCIMCHNATS